MDDGQRSCDVLAKKPIKRSEAQPKPVKTKDRGTQTIEKGLKKVRKPKAPAAAPAKMDVASSSERSPEKTTMLKKRKYKQVAFEEDGDQTVSVGSSPKKRAKKVAGSVHGSASSGMKE